MTKRFLGIVKEDKGEGQGAKNAILQTHNLPASARKSDTAKSAKIITTRDAAKKGK